MSDRPELTREEAAAIAAFKRLARKWPESLWLFSGSGGVNVLKKDATGQKVHAGESIDQDFVVGHIDIDADGGDW